MALKCDSCGYENEACIVSFDVENSFGNHERLYLLQCDRCRAFSIVIWEDDWMSETPEHWYYQGPYTAEQAETIFGFFVSCRRYKDCECKIHQAVHDWIDPFGKRVPIFDRGDLIARIQRDRRYPEWLQEWKQVVLPPMDVT